MLPLDAQILIAGNGRVAQRHIANLLLLGYQHLTLMDSVASRGNFSADKLIKTENNWQKIMAKTWDAAFVLPNEHIAFQHIMELIEKGAHCFIEPGIHLSEAQADQLKDAALCSKAGVQFNFPLRWHPLIVYARELMLKEAQGLPIVFDIQRKEVQQELDAEVFEPEKCLIECVDLIQNLLQSGNVNSSTVALEQLTYKAGIVQLSNKHTGTIQLVATAFEPTFKINIHLHKQEMELDLLAHTLKIRRLEGTQLFQPEPTERNRLYMNAMVEFLEKCSALKPIDSIKAVNHYFSLLQKS
jgi:hypothetical protein